ncbi:MAG: hypothetical protein AAF740_01460, partial [Bacteroidota bacterium]
IKFLMILNLLNSVLRLLNVNETGIGVLEIIWFTLGIASLVILYLFTFNRSTSEKIPVHEIEGLNEKSIFGKSRFSIELLNGKKRQLTNPQTPSELTELKKIFSEIRVGG